MVGMSVDFLSLIERGRNAPPFEKLEFMAKGLGVPVAFLFTFDSDSRLQKRRMKKWRSKVKLIEGSSHSGICRPLDECGSRAEP